MNHILFEIQDFAQALLMRLAPVLVLCVIGITVHKANQLTDPKKKHMAEEGYDCVAPGFKLRCIIPAIFFMFMLMFGFCYVGASMDGYMDSHPDFRYMVIALILLCAAVGVLFIHITRSMRVFYRQDGIVRDKPFGHQIDIEANQIESIVFTVSDLPVSAVISTLSDGVILLDHTHDGFEEFFAFANRYWKKKCEIKLTKGAKKNIKKHREKVK